MLGVTAPSFNTMFEARALEMTRLVLNYVKQLEGMAQPAAGMTGTAPAASKTKPVLQNGFPKLPSDFNGMKYNKKELEQLYRDYIGTHYCKWFHVDTTHTVDTFVGNATEHRTRQAPWSRMKEDTLKYVDAEYLPWPDFVLDDPRALKLDVLRAYFAYIAEREKTFALDEVFRFKYVEANRKEGQEASANENIGAGTLDSASNETRADDPDGAEQPDGHGMAGTPMPDSRDGPNDTQERVDAPGTGEIPPPSPPPLPNTATMKKMKKSRAGTKSRKNTAAPEGTRSNGALQALPPTSQMPQRMGNQQTAVDPAGDAGGAVAPARPRPRPRPVTRTGVQSGSGPGVETSHQAPGTYNDQQPPIQPPEIDPSLLAASIQPSRALVNTSDNLALQEASRFSVTGKRVPKKRQQV
jgi:hypothetical protein